MNSMKVAVAHVTLSPASSQVEEEDQKELKTLQSSGNKKMWEGK